jgi:small subunit ribosomal protein S17
MNEQVNKIERILTGKVTSNKMDKTIVVLVQRQIQHALYKKILKRSTKIHAHDADNACNIGDVVKIAETRPISKTKAWKLVEIVEKAT